ncbi:MAG: FTR1 family protein [Burkholderiales bacterium]|nr:FTR1 family protein [Burkholderiales bacterium]
MCLRELFLLVFLLVPLGAPAAPPDSQAVLNMLDYVSVEYPEFVRDGQVLDQEEYAEQVEFSSRVRDLVGAMPAGARHTDLVNQAEELVGLIADKAQAQHVVALARKLQAGLVTEYQIVVAPRRAPDPAEGAQLYASNCGSCHGAQGRGNGPAAAGLDPAPTDFTDVARASARSVFGLYNTISLGVTGTSMPAFAQMTDAQRWALAFHVASFSNDPAQVRDGEAAWRAGEGRKAFPGLAQAVTVTPLEARSSGPRNDAVLAYLRAHPQALTAHAGSPLDFSLSALAHSIQAVRAGRHDDAYRLAVTAYLEGFELAEPGLASRDPDLLARTEQAMMTYRNAVHAGAPAGEIEAAYVRAVDALQLARTALAASALSPAAGFAGSIVIILREGLEAILVLAAMAAFLVKTGRREEMRWLHAGWIGALLLGAVTWAVSSTIIRISGAQREVTEGVTALLSAGVLLYVGFWLHSKSNARRWSMFIRDRMAGAGADTRFGARAALGIALVAFLAVYREVFETVLFYQALWAQAAGAGRNAILFGLAAGVVGLLVMAWLIIRLSVHLPLGLFFGASSLLLAVMAVVFAGQGIAALQEAGKLPLHPLDFPAVPMLGIYPNLQGIGLQLALIVVIVGGWYLVREQSRKT